MANGKGSSFSAGIDPGFIGVPEFRRSSFDPVQFTRQLVQERRAMRLAQDDKSKKEKQQSIDFVRKNYGDVDIKAWEDKNGYKELMKEKNAIQSKALEAVNKGYNLYTPETPQEMALMRELNQDMTQLEFKADIWGEHKRKVDALDEEYRKQMLMDPTEQTMDPEKYKQFREAYMSSDKGILDRTELLNTYDFNKPKQISPSDMSDYVRKEIAATIPGMDKNVLKWDVDPNSGDITKTTWEGVSPERIKTGLRKIYNRTQGQERAYFDQGFEKAVKDGFDGTLNEWLVQTYAPEYAEKISKTIVKGSDKDEEKRLAVKSAIPSQDSSGNFDLSQNMAIKTYGTTKGGTTYTNQYNSMATLPVMSIFKNKAFVMPVTDNTVNKATGEPAPKGIDSGSTPVDISFIPTADKKYVVEMTPTGAGVNIKPVYETVMPGERISKQVQEVMARKNAEALQNNQPPPYPYHILPYVETQEYKSMMKDPANPDSPWMIPKPESEKMTTIRPYNEARIHLKNYAAALGQDFTEIDDAVLQIEDQLNNFGKLFDDGQKEVTKDEEYNSLFN